MRSYLTGWVREVGLWVLVGCGMYLMLSLVTYVRQDPGWSYAGPRNLLVGNAGGALGAWCADVLFYLFGYIAFLLPIGLVWFALVNLYLEDVSLSRRVHILPLQWAGFIVAIITSAALADAYVRVHPSQMPAGSGGVFGQFTADIVISHLTPLKGILSLLFAAIVGFTLFSGFNWLRLMEFLGWIVVHVVSWVFLPIVYLISKLQEALVAITSVKSVPVETANELEASNGPETVAEVGLLDQDQEVVASPPLESEGTTGSCAECSEEQQDLESQLPLVPAEQTLDDVLLPLSPAEPLDVQNTDTDSNYLLPHPLAPSP